jgi:ribosomal protein L37E
MLQRQEGPQTPYEVYCYHCEATFAVGTRRCVHCGQPIGGRARRPRAEGAPEVMQPEPMEEEVLEPSIARRLGGTSLWVLIAIAAAASRLCAEG